MLLLVSKCLLRCLLLYFGTSPSFSIFPSLSRFCLFLSLPLSFFLSFRRSFFIPQHLTKILFFLLVRVHPFSACQKISRRLLTQSEAWNHAHTHPSTHTPTHSFSVTHTPTYSLSVTLMHAHKHLLLSA